MSTLHGETGMELLLRLKPTETLKSSLFGEFSTGNTIFLSTPCSFSKAAMLTKLVVETVLPQAYGGFEKNILLLDLAYQLNMLAVLEGLEQKLKSEGVSSSVCDKVISSSPSRVKVFRPSTSLQLFCLLASIKETVVEEKITLLVCNCSNVYSMTKADLSHLHTSLTQLTQLCNVAVIFMSSHIIGFPPVKIAESSDIYWKVTQPSNDCLKHFLTIKQTSKDGSTRLFKKELSF